MMLLMVCGKCGKKNAFLLLISYSTKGQCYSTGLSTRFYRLLLDNYHILIPLPRGGRMKVVENANGGEKVAVFSVQIDVRNDCFFV